MRYSQSQPQRHPQWLWSDEQRSSHTSTHILYDQAVLTEPSPEWAFATHWAQHDRIMHRLGGRGQAVWVALDEANSGQQAVLRRYQRGGLMAKLTSDHYLYLGLERTRAVREFRLLGTLNARGLAVPRPLMATIEREGPMLYRQSLMTQAIVGAQPLAQVMADGSTIDWNGLAKVLALFLDQGVFHPDLNANNILLDQEQQWWLIDFDRARLGPSPRPGRCMVKRLCASFEKLGLSVPFTRQHFFAKIQSHR